MQQFLLACSADKPTESLLDDCIKQLGDIPSEATFGFLYMSDHLANEAPHLLQQLEERTGIKNWIGTVSMSLISSGQEYYDQTAIIIMLADFNTADFYILPNITDNLSVLSDDLKNWCDSNDFNVGLIHADPENQALQPLLQELSQTLPNSFLIGGITAANTTNFQFANSIHQNGLSGVLFSQNIPILSNLSQGCSPIGPRHRVTESDKNIIITLDNKPALDVLTDDTGEVIARDWELAAGYIFSGLVNKNSDTDDYTIRHLIGVDTDNKLFAISDNVEDDQEIIFCRRDGNTANEDMQRMLLQLKKRLSSPIKGGVYISCVGRGREQFGTNSEEARLIHSVLGDFPLVGFFANGEIHKNMLYGFTGVLTLFV